MTVKINSMQIAGQLTTPDGPACAWRSNRKSQRRPVPYKRQHRTSLDRRQRGAAQAFALALELPAPTSFGRPAVNPDAPVRPPQAQASELQWPTNFHQRYVLGKKLGVGSYGTCYIAIDRASGRSGPLKLPFASVNKLRVGKPHEKA